MKKLTRLLMLFTFAAIASCTPEKEMEKPMDPDTPAAETMEVSGELKAFPAESDDVQTLKVKANCKWTAKVSEEWCKVSPLEGESGETVLEISVSKNEGSEIREAELEFASETGKVTEKLKVTQLYAGVVNLTTDEFNLDAAAQNIEVKLEANVDFEVSVDQDWISRIDVTKAMKPYTLGFAVKANDGKGDRQAKITIDYCVSQNPEKHSVKIVTVNQTAKTQYLLITHSNKNMTVPVLTGEGFSAKVIWEEGQTPVQYESDLKYNYQTSAPYVLELQGHAVNEVMIPKITGISKIDFSRF